MNSPNYKEFNDADYTMLRKSLLRPSARRIDRQREFLGNVLHTQNFLELMEKEVGLVGDDEFDLLAEKMSEAEFKDPPADTERRLFEAWTDLKPRIACRTSFWGHVTLRHIQEGRIESSYLAANGGSLSGGAVRIERALAAQGGDAPRLLDRCVRTVFRRLSGLPERGNRTVYVNCPLSRSWWRERFVQEASGGDPQTARQVGQVVRISQEYWERLVVFVVSRNSVFGSPEIRATFVRSIGQHMDGNPLSLLRNRDDFLQPASRTLSALQASRELSVLPPQDAERIVDDVVLMHLQTLNDRA